MKNRKVWRVAALGVMVAAAAMIQACTDDQVDAVGDAVIVAGGILIAANSPCVGGYRQVCHNYDNYEGAEVTECRQEWNDCAHLEALSNAFGQSEGGAKPMPDDLVTPVKWGETFGISYDSSARLIAAMKETQTGKLDEAQALGLSRNDLEAVSFFQVPPEPSIERLARNLDATPAATRAMLQRLVETMKGLKQGAGT